MACYRLLDAVLVVDVEGQQTHWGQSRIVASGASTEPAVAMDKHSSKITRYGL